MRDDLADLLTAKVMNWSPEDITRERPDLQAMARYKYDNYQRFFPGRRFVESLAQWLRQFETDEERRTAYKFVKSKMVFCSEAEMTQLVSMAYPDRIRPLLLKEAAQVISCPKYQVAKIARSEEFRVLQRQSLFLGLSDGAHIDLFRRLNREEISHEQIGISYDVSKSKADEFVDKLRKDLTEILKRTPDDKDCRFRNLFLLDDFSGSGKSYLRRADSNFKGKIARVIDNIKTDESPLSEITEDGGLLICVVLYMATTQSVEHLESLIQDLVKDDGHRCEFLVVQTLDQRVKVEEGRDGGFMKLVEKYYDPRIESEATRVGGTGELKLGFAECSLPLVLFHNTPNNSVALLWSYEHLRIRGLFPRVTRH